MVDVLDNVKTLLEDNWNSTNTDSITPTVDIIMNRKEINLGNGDFILLYEITEDIAPFGLGAQEWEHIRTFSIDIRSTYKRAAIGDIRAHLTKVKDEVYRIAKSKVSDPDSDHQLWLIIRRKDLSDKNAGMGRMVIDCQMKYWGT